MKIYRKARLTTALLANACSLPALADSVTMLAITSPAETAIEQMVVTGVKTEQPLSLVTDPKRPRQPLPANDGADYLKTIAGFSVIRKGGSDGDPVLRGMAGSRLNILLDGESILGGCNNRMDPPTAYIFPETFDQIEVIKGPQTVRYGPGNSAGVVRFERDQERPQESEWDFHASLLAASYQRRDGLIEAAYRSPEFTLRGTITSASAADYEDGDGVTVHSRYERWSGQLGFAWTPTEDTRLEISSTHSDGEAAYADRGVDGSRFARENVNAKYLRNNISERIQSIELQGYYNYVDHVMDNYTLREPSGMMTAAMAMNPDRKTSGGKFAVTLTPQEEILLTLGLDTQQNLHSIRSSLNQASMDFHDLKRAADAEFSQTGVYSELNWEVAPGHRWVAGTRLDDWQVRDLRNQIRMSMMSAVDNPTAGKSRTDVLQSGFVRHEKTEETAAGSAATLYAGIGYSERFPDYWEIIAKESEDSVSALDIAPEKTSQLDIGAIYRNETLSASISAFANWIDDYLLIHTGFSKVSTPGEMGGVMSGMVATGNNRSATIVRNVDARSWGMEMDLGYRMADNWRTELTLSSVRGANDSDNTTLAQLPPLEARLGLHYAQKDWSAGLLWRRLAAQERVDIGKGNIAGQDIGATDAANILSANVGWRPATSLLLTAGIDNLLDENYAEHISRAGVAIPGFEQLSKINEPGRTLWMKAIYGF